MARKKKTTMTFNADDFSEAHREAFNSFCQVKGCNNKYLSENREEAGIVTNGKWRTRESYMAEAIELLMKKYHSTEDYEQMMQYYSDKHSNIKVDKKGPDTGMP